MSTSVLSTSLVGTSAWAVHDDTQAQFYPFSVESQKDGDGSRVVALNRGPAPVAVKISIPEFTGIATDRPTPLFAQVEPGYQPVVLLRVQRAVKGEAYTFRTSSNWMVGKLDAIQAEDAAYRLPFGNRKEFSFSQVPGGPITTRTVPVSRYAVDIAMPEGTTIVASRGGGVISTVASQEFGALDPALIDKANEVRILHEDGAIATYAHFAPQGVLVVPGQHVSAGAEIGLAGSTGYSSGPHLHLAVQTVRRVADELALVSMPFRSVNGTPLEAFTPRYGEPARAEYDAPQPVGAKVLEPEHEPSATNMIKVSLHPQPSTFQQPSFEEPPSAQSLFLHLPDWSWLAGVAALLTLASRKKRGRAQT